MKMSIVWRHDVLEQWEIYGGTEGQGMSASLIKYYHLQLLVSSKI